MQDKNATNTIVAFLLTDTMNATPAEVLDLMRRWFKWEAMTGLIVEMEDVFVNGVVRYVVSKTDDDSVWTIDEIVHDMTPEMRTLYPRIRGWRGVRTANPVAFFRETLRRHPRWYVNWMAVRMHSNNNQLSVYIRRDRNETNGARAANRASSRITRGVRAARQNPTTRLHNILVKKPLARRVSNMIRYAPAGGQHGRIRSFPGGAEYRRGARRWSDTTTTTKKRRRDD